MKNFRGVYRSKRDAKIIKNGKAGDYFYYRIEQTDRLPIYRILVYSPEFGAWKWIGTFDPYESWRKQK